MNDTNIKISACLVVYNDAALLPRCLDSLTGVVDEIIIVNDGPIIDETAKIAEQYGARLIIAPRVGVAEPIRHLSYEAAQGEWILQIDADEFLSEELSVALPELVTKKDIDAYEFIWPIYNGQKYLTKSWPYKRCLFRRSAMSFIGLPNYIVELRGAVHQESLILEHRPNYNNYSWKVFKNKWLAWARIQASLYSQDFKQVPKFQYESKNWPRNIRLRRAFPLLIMPFDALVIFIKTLFPQGYKQGYIALKVALMFAAFRIAVDWYLYKAIGIPDREEELPSCLCGKINYKIYSYSRDGIPFQVLYCRSCGLGRTWPKPLEDDISEKFYNDYDDYKERLEFLPLRRRFAHKTLSIIKHYRPSGTLLDVGCNLGVFVKEALAMGYQAEGVDLSQEAITEGQKSLDLGDRLHCGYVDEPKYRVNEFDVITYIHCLEHISSIEEELEKIKSLLAPDGLLVIEVPNFVSLWRLVLGARWYGFSPSQHIWQFGKRGLVNVLKRASFEVVTAKTHLSLHHKITFSISGLIKSAIALLALLSAKGDSLIIIARKK